ncbi:peptidoglycan-binding protein [Microseira sp. BLCC-F43]|jgi:peptidoglycan hydrolase-like protein with peptidoglycan-binding domain|uniref:peptidoglycan-binding domain-containing protein n=1 Tax=Microseira sp. BLCC-F43 TaxID=3153602 RepID=UPI0035B9B6A6
MAIFSDTEGTHAGHTTLKKGATGEEVKHLQQLLNHFYGSVLTVDGNFGSKTEDFVKRFQAACSLTVNGIVDSETWLNLEQIKSHTGKPHPTLRNGDKGDEVKYLQVRLNGHYGAKVVVDGNFGSKTEVLVKQFQADRKLTVDGIVGSKTWSFLEQPNYDV